MVSEESCVSFCVPVPWMPGVRSHTSKQVEEAFARHMFLIANDVACEWPLRL